MQDWVVKLTRIRRHETKGKNTIMAIFVTVIRYIQKNLSTTYDCKSDWTAFFDLVEAYR